MNEVSNIFGKKLNSSLFTWSNYCGHLGYSVLTVFENTGKEIINEIFILEGWCYGYELEVRNRNNGIAILLLDVEENQNFWCHINEDFMEMLENSYELKNRIY